MKSNSPPTRALSLGEGLDYTAIALDLRITIPT
jgi:hypothetical protein